MRLRRKRAETYDEMRKRMIQETEVALLYGLRFPSRLTTIPTREVGKSEFDPIFAERFWKHVLELGDGHSR